MNKRGAAALEVMASITLLAILVIITTNAQSYLAVHKSNVTQKETFITHMETELTNIYYNDLLYEDKIIDTDAGELKVTMEHQGINEHGVDVEKVTFTAENLNKSFEVERSRYYVE